MPTRGQDRFSFNPRIRGKRDSTAADRIDLLKPIDMHALLLKVGLLFDLGTGVLEGFSRHDEIDMRFINAVQ